MSYNISNIEELTPTIMGRILNNFSSVELPKFRKWRNYYEGKQAILNKVYADDSKPCNKIIKNYCHAIVENYTGYILGNPISYTSTNDIAALMDIFQYNDIENADTRLLKEALICGKSYEIEYLDEQGMKRFKALPAEEVIPIYDSTIDENLIAAIRFYKKPTWDNDRVNETYIVEVYDSARITTYECNNGFSSFTLVGEVPHYFQDVPFVEFKLNDEEESIFNQIISLQDAYNSLLSGEIDDWDAFVDAYLVLKGVGIDAEGAAAMRENRILVMDADDTAEYLTKPSSDTQIENMLKNINDSIHVIANSPDFNDEKFMATSGISMKFKLIGFTNRSKAITANLTKAIQRRIELQYNILGLIQSESFADVEIKFTFNIPTDEAVAIQMVNSLRGFVSDETLLSQLPFVSDVSAEMDRMARQKEADADLYGFSQAVNEV